MTIINKSLCCGIKTEGFIYMFAWISHILWLLHKFMTVFLILSVGYLLLPFFSTDHTPKPYTSVCTNYKGSRMVMKKTLKNQILQKPD